MTTLGEGGMITTDDPELAQRLRGIRMWGSGTEEWGGNYKLTKVQAAVGLVQLRRLDEMLARRHEHGRRRTELLEEYGHGDVALPVEPQGYKHTYYLYTLTVPPEWAGDRRDRVIEILRDERGIGAEIANPPVSLNPYIRRHTEGQALPLSEDLGRRILCPSLHPLMSEADNEYVAAAISEAIERVTQEGD
jgi:dTDP-4-amino-4,6-dideoxygalactose transaminase